MSNDMDDLVENDAKMARDAVTRYRKQGSVVGGLGEVIEGVLWTFAALAVLGMVVSMPWVGQDKLISGEVWIGLSIGGIVVFGGLAFVTRWLRTQAAMGELDEGVDVHRRGGSGRR